MCLDDESPSTPGERHTQFLLNGSNHTLANRWMDKSLQLAVTANGVSAGIYDHTMIDGLDGRAMHRHITKALYTYNSWELDDQPQSLSTYPVKKIAWNYTDTVVQGVQRIQEIFNTAYDVVDFQFVIAKNLSLPTLRSHRAAPNATTHLVALLAAHLIDGSIRPTWEVASQAQFRRGRFEWVQTVSPPVRAFIEAAAAGTASRAVFDAAAISYTRAIATAASGHGFVNHMYALRMLLQPGEEIPEIFKSHTWQTTRRGGLEQTLKIGFMPDSDDIEEERLYGSDWDSGGFLVSGHKAVYLHCDIIQSGIRFGVSASPDYLIAVVKALRRASEIVLSIFEQD